jgi:DNA-binding MarR family transcriptional regulator
MQTTLRQASSTSQSTGELAGHLRLAVTRLARRMRQEAGEELTPSQVAALAAIDRHGPLTPSELAEIERIRRPTATRVLALLEQDGLIERQQDPLDRRSALVRTTSAGRTKLRRLRTRKTAYLGRLMRDLEPAELRTLGEAATIIERLLQEDRLPEGRA